MAQNFIFNLGNLKIDQMSFVYKDIRKQAKWLKILNLI